MTTENKPARARALPAAPDGQKCTWEGCGCKATFSQVNKEGVFWAYLCVSHRMALAFASRAGGRALLRAWARAQGGAEIASRRFAESMEAEKTANAAPVSELADEVAKSVTAD